MGNKYKALFYFLLVLVLLTIAVLATYFVVSRRDTPQILSGETTTESTTSGDLFPSPEATQETSQLGLIETGPSLSPTPSDQITATLVPPTATPTVKFEVFKPKFEVEKLIFTPTPTPTATISFMRPPLRVTISF